MASVFQRNLFQHRATEDSAAPKLFQIDPLPVDSVRPVQTTAFRAPVYSHVFEKPTPAELDFRSAGGGLAYGGEAVFEWSVRELLFESRGSFTFRGRGLRVGKMHRAAARLSVRVGGAAATSAERRHPVTRLSLTYGGAARVDRVDAARVRADDAAVLGMIRDLLL